MEWLNQLNLNNRDLLSDGVTLLLEMTLVIVTFIVIKLLLKFAQKRLLLLQPTLEEKLNKTFKLINWTTTFTFLLLLFVVININLYQFYLGVDLKIYALSNIEKIPNNFWTNLGIGFAKIIGLFIAAKFIVKKTLPLLERLRDQAVAYKGLKENDKAVISFFSHLSRMVKNIIWLSVLYAVTQWFPFPEQVGEYIMLAIRIYIIVTVAMLIVNAVDAIVATFDDFSKHYASKNDFIIFYDSLKHLIPLFKKTIEYIIYVSAATLIISQLDFISGLAQYGAAAIRSIGIIFISRVVIEIMKLLIDINYLHDDLDEETKKRNETIFPIMKSIIATFIYFVAIILVMKSFGFDPLPLLAGAGILGMVIGLGAQQLINDIVSGFFIIFEQSIQKGDYIKAGEAEGVVESIGLRITQVRSDDGELHILKNGSIADLVNYSTHYVNAVVNVGVSANSDLATIYKTLKELGEELKTNNPNVLDVLTVDGVDDFSGPEIVIRTITKVKAGKHRLLKRIIQEKIIATFNEKGIEIPFEKRYDM